MSAMNTVVMASDIDVAGIIAMKIMEGEIKSREELEQAKVEICRKYSCNKIPPNSEVLARIPKGLRGKYLPLLRKKPTRTLSGVAVIAAMTSPAKCPHGKCMYCPGGVDMGTAQSYTGREPASLRAISNNYDPYEQVKNRIEQLKAIGHYVDKVDMIIMGGTFTSRPKSYQEWFAKRCFDALNGVSSKNIREAHMINESAEARCIGLTVETRPDCFGWEEAKFSAYLGATRVELGVQNLYDDVLERVERGHGVAEVIKATRVAKEIGLKVCYHLMPFLPYSSWQKDIETFRMVFYDPRFMPDMIKIYPTLVIKGTKLYDMWLRGEYQAYTLQDAVELIARVKRMIPPWVRVQRVQRDIPAYLVEAGVKHGNLRQLAHEYMKNAGWRCRCIRCREAGRVGAEYERVGMVWREYKASGGREVFLSYENDEGALFAYIRLRLGGRAIVRELKVVGTVLPIGKDARMAGEYQHRGMGRKLLAEAEEIAKSAGYDYLYITSGVGVRGYYRRLGYALREPYMVKRI